MLERGLPLHEKEVQLKLSTPHRQSGCCQPLIAKLDNMRFIAFLTLYRQCIELMKTGS